MRTLIDRELNEVPLGCGCVASRVLNMPRGMFIEYGLCRNIHSGMQRGAFIERALCRKIIPNMPRGMLEKR